MAKVKTQASDAEGKINTDEDRPVTGEQGGETKSAAILQLVEVEADAVEDVDVAPEIEDAVEFRFEGESFDPFENFSVLALIDVAPKVKKIRKIPAFFHINRPVTKIGNGKRADFKVDDFESVRTEHGAIVFKDGNFSVFPQDGLVIADGKGVSEKGEVLENGSTIEMGRAKFVFLKA